MQYKNFNKQYIPIIEKIYITSLIYKNMKQISEAIDTFYEVESVAFGASLNVLAHGRP